MKTLKQEVERIIDFVDISKDDSEKTAKIKAEIVNRGTDFIDDFFREIIKEIESFFSFDSKDKEKVIKMIKQKGDLE